MYILYIIYTSHVFNFNLKMFEIIYRVCFVYAYNNYYLKVYAHRNAITVSLTYCNNMSYINIQ